MSCFKNMKKLVIHMLKYATNSTKWSVQLRRTIKILVFVVSANKLQLKPDGFVTNATPIVAGNVQLWDLLQMLMLNTDNSMKYIFKLGFSK